MKNVVVFAILMATVIALGCGPVVLSPTKIKGQGNIAFTNGVTAPTDFCISVNNGVTRGYINVEYPKNDVKAKVMGIWGRNDGSTIINGTYTDSAHPHEVGTMTLIITNSLSQGDQATANLEFYMSDPINGDYSGKLMAKEETSQGNDVDCSY